MTSRRQQLVPGTCGTIGTNPYQGRLAEGQYFIEAVGTIAACTEYNKARY